MIKAYAEMIRDLSGENKVKRDQHTNVIIDEADRLAMLVNDILNLSKLQNSTEIMTLSQVNLTELIESVIYKFEEFMHEEGYIIERDLEVDLFTLCDEQKIEQVIYNLIGNSINYTGPDKTVKVSLHQQGENILLEIIDSDKGISPEQIDGIWEKYYRFSDTHQRPIKGTGLGLSIVKTILQNHKLKFGVISKKGVGSNFFIEFKGLKDEQ
jgi:signal transduction histidine kinase